MIILLIFQKIFIHIILLQYHKRLKRLATEYDPDGRQAEADREWIRDYEERESWNNMGGI